ALLTDSVRPGVLVGVLLRVETLDDVVLVDTAGDHDRVVELVQRLVAEVLRPDHLVVDAVLVEQPHVPSAGHVADAAQQPDPAARPRPTPPAGSDGPVATPAPRTSRPGTSRRRR